MNYWLFKTEPEVYAVGDIASAIDQICVWDGIRNYQARNFLRDQTSVGDRVFLYHCQCARPGIYGIAQVRRAGYPDPAQFNPASPYYDAKATPSNPRWYCVDLRLEQVLKDPILLPRLKTHTGLTQLGLFKQPRLSVVPVTQDENLLLRTLVGQ